jgi:hypothetical protein
MRAAEEAICELPGHAFQVVQAAKYPAGLQPAARRPFDRLVGPAALVSVLEQLSPEPARLKAPCRRPLRCFLPANLATERQLPAPDDNPQPAPKFSGQRDRPARRLI